MAGATDPAQVLVLTRIWPTAERPSVGTYIRERTLGVPGLRVVRPRHPGWPRLLIYPELFLGALLARGPVAGIEAHMLFPTAIVGLLAARLRRVPLVVYVHGGDVRGWERQPFPVRWLKRLAATRADTVVTNSEDSAEHLRRLGREPVVIPPGVDMDRFRPSPRPEKRRVLYLGGRNARKGFEVARPLADTLVGPWLRDVAPADVPALIAEHDVVLVPSVDEPFGLVAVEAIASGRWVVASAVGGLRDIVEDGVNGTLVADGDFAGALARVPDYDPYAIATTVERFSLRSWQAALADLWGRVQRGERDA